MFANYIEINLKADKEGKGETNFIIDDFDNLSALPIEVKSGKDYKIHSALTNFLSTPQYNIKRAIVLSNSNEVITENGITYMPIYYSMFIIVPAP